ncbi:MAG: restriction endonuclease subunit S, partial [Methanosphaera stadtmanae]|nr:restriction endonuclease subunit S [Methanosphaera stadtmanae]
MMKAEDLKNSVLQMAMQGKLVPQDPNDESASMLLEKIKQEKEQLIKDKKIKRNNKESTIWKENGHWYEKIGKNGDITCIDTEIPFKIPESWCWTKLNVMGFIQTGNTPPTKNPENYGDYIPFIKPGDIYYNKINYENEFLSKIGESRGRIIKKNSVMMVCIGGSRGKCYYNKRDVCCNQQINTITPYLIDYKFVFYYFCTKYFQNKMINDATGTATPLVNKTSWGNFFIPIPSLKEQKRIVEKLEQILPQIEQYAKYEEKLTKLNNEFPDKLKKSILQQAIQGKLVPQNPEDEPATILLEKIKQEKEQLIKEGKIKRNKNESTIYKKDGHWYEVIDKFNEVKCIDEEIPFKIPKNWIWG